MEINQLRNLFDLGIEIIQGDDEIQITGRDFLKGEMDNEFCYQERMWVFHYETSINDIYNKIKLDLNK